MVGVKHGRTPNARTYSKVCFGLEKNFKTYSQVAFYCGPVAKRFIQRRGSFLIRCVASAHLVFLNLDLVTSTETTVQPIGGNTKHALQLCSQKRSAESADQPR